ncbi:MAG: sugar ABC transporter substrate-binding protein [Vicinamibacterales bacterium]|jgi:ribose transport system substrate-binding protein|nr:sugar ABC transporter substrate-binding protein [Vicinamibacterales bacterium]
MTNIRRATIGVVTLMLAGAIACQENPDNSAAPAGDAAASPADSRPKVALVMKSLANEFFQTMEDGARAHQAQDPARYELFAEGIKNELDVARQIDLVEQMVARGAQALVLAPADSRALVAAAAHAVEAGLTVVNIDNRLDEDALAERDLNIPFVGPDNRGGARQAADVLARTLNRGDEVAIIEGAPGAFNAIQRRLGFEDAMNEAGMTVVASQSGYWEMDRANQVAASLLLAHPDLDALLCANDSMALGTVAAVRAAGKEGSVRVVGFDNISAVRTLVEDGSVLATVDQHADEIAVNGIEHALAILDETQEPVDLETEVTLITADTVQ